MKTEVYLRSGGFSDVRKFHACLACVESLRTYPSREKYGESTTSLLSVQRVLHITFSAFETSTETDLLYFHFRGIKHGGFG